MTRIVEYIYDVKADSNGEGVMNTFAYALFALQIVSANLSLTILDCDPGDRIVIMREAFVKMLATAKQHAYWKCDKVIPISTNFFQNKEVKPQSGNFQLFSADFDWNSVGVKATDVESLKKKYSLFKDREFTEEEKDMLESNQTGEYYKPSENVISMVKKVAKSWERDPRLRKKNILLEGPTGTGKTQDSKVFADIIGLPYTKVTCFSDMDSSDVAGAIYPVLEDRKHYTKADIEFDPEGVFEELTGEFRSNAMELSMYTTLLRLLRRLRMVGCLKFKNLLVSLMLLFCLCLTRHLKVMAFLIYQTERLRGIQTSFV